MRVQDPADACQAMTGEESGCQLVPDTSRDMGRPGKRALVMGAFSICSACWAISAGENAIAATAKKPIAVSRNRFGFFIETSLMISMPPCFTISSKMKLAKNAADQIGAAMHFIMSDPVMNVKHFSGLKL